MSPMRVSRLGTGTVPFFCYSFAFAFGVLVYLDGRVGVIHRTS